MPAAEVTFVNSIGAARGLCAVSFETKIEQIAVKENISIRTESAIIGEDRRLQPLLECWDMLQLVVSACVFCSILHLFGADHCAALACLSAYRTALALSNLRSVYMYLGRYPEATDAMPTLINPEIANVALGVPCFT